MRGEQDLERLRNAIEQLQEVSDIIERTRVFISETTDDDLETLISEGKARFWARSSRYPGEPPLEAIPEALQAAIEPFARQVRELQARHDTAPSPSELVRRLQEIEDALLEIMGFQPVGKRGFYIDTQGDERTSPGVDWPRSTALDFARERVTRGAK